MHELIKKLVELYSPYGSEQEVASLLVSEMKARGFEAFVDEVGNAIGIIGSKEKSATQILFAGHMDVYPGELPVKVKNGILYGRGSVDAKGCIASIIEAAADLAAEDLENKQIVIACCVEEEGPSSKGARNLLNHAFIDPDYLIIGEPSGWDGLTIGYKGVLSFQYRYEQDNFHYGVDQDRVTDMALDFLADLKLHIRSLTKESFFNSPSLEIRNINSDNNGVEEHCDFSVVIRIPPGFDLAALKNWIGSKLSGVEFSQSDPAVLSNPNNDLFKAFRKQIKSAGGKALPKKKYGTSDMNILTPHYNVPTIAYGPGDSKLDHTPEEHLVLEELEKTIRITAEALRDL